MDPSAPRVQRRLATMRARLEEQGHKRQQQYARELAEAAELGRRHRLGEVVGIYAEKRSDNGAGWGILLFMLLLLCGITTVVEVARSVLRRYPPGASFMGIVIVAGLVIAFFALLALAWTLMRRPPRLAWLYAYTEGMLAPGQRNAYLAQPLRWDTIGALYEVWRPAFDPVSEESTPRFAGYCLCLSDGGNMTMSGAYRNMLDHYAEVRPLLASLLPSAVAAAIPAYPTLGLIIERTILDRRLPAALLTFHAGQALTFGALHLDWLGLATDDRPERLGWNEVERIGRERDALVVRRRGGHAPWAAVPMTGVPDACVLLALLAETHPQATA